MNMNMPCVSFVHGFSVAFQGTIIFTVGHIYKIQRHQTVVSDIAHAMFFVKMLIYITSEAICLQRPSNPVQHQRLTALRDISEPLYIIYSGCLALS